MRDRYQIVHKLDHGTFSTLWLARDRQQKSYVAVKVGTADSTSREAGSLRTIGGSPGVPDSPRKPMLPLIHGEFEIQSSNGSHRCYVTSPARCSIAAAKLTTLFSLESARAIAGQLVLAVAYVHAQGFVHGGKLYR
jgi:serine/threonine protein kinase